MWKANNAMQPRFFLILMLFLTWAASTRAQDSTATLQVTEWQIETQRDAFGGEASVLIGTVAKTGEETFDGVQVYATLYNADEELIGEGLGYLVDRCGVALLDFALAPGMSHRFAVTLDLFGAGDVETVEFEFLAGITDAPDYAAPAGMQAVTQIVRDDEAVSVEWEGPARFRYGLGCNQQLFTTYDWFSYDLETQTSAALEEHPSARFVTDAMIARAGINQITQQGGGEDPSLFERSMLTYAPDGRRALFQSDLHTLFSIEPDGTLRRFIVDQLYQYTLQGFIWSPLGNFVAYYFGAYAEPVRYFTASIQGSMISARLQNTRPSLIVPGLTDDGARAIIGASLPDASGEEQLGYYLVDTRNNSTELLFTVDALPGNNYPAPAYWRKDNNTRYVFVVRDVEGVPTLQCYHREGGTLSTLTPLPLNLRSDERAWTWLAPDGSALALGANGRYGGLWLVDLTQFEACR